MVCGYLIQNAVVHANRYLSSLRDSRYVEDGELKGIMPDYFAAVMDMAGLPYELVGTPDRASYFELADSGSGDVIIDVWSEALCRSSPGHTSGKRSSHRSQWRNAGNP